MDVVAADHVENDVNTVIQSHFCQNSFKVFRFVVNSACRPAGFERTTLLIAAGGGIDLGTQGGADHYAHCTHAAGSAVDENFFSRLQPSTLE